MQAVSAPDPNVALMLRVKSGDISAFEELILRHQRSVINAAYRYTGNPSVAEELAQDVFLRVFRAAPSYEPDARFTTWLFTIVRNVCSNYRTREGRIDSQVEPEAEVEVVAAASNPEQLAIRNQARTGVREAVSQLPESLRLPLILSHFSELSYDEVAQALSLSLAAVKVRIHRAKLMLAEKLIAPVTGKAAGGFHKEGDTDGHTTSD